MKRECAMNRLITVFAVALFKAATGLAQSWNWLQPAE